MSGVVVLLVVAAIVGLILWAAVASVRRNRARAAATAARLGFEYREQDAFGLAGLPMPLMRMGDRRSADHVFSGTWQGLGVRVFQYTYTESESVVRGVEIAGGVLSVLAGGRGGSSMNRAQDTTYRFTCALTTLPFAGPTTTIGREGFFSRLRDVTGFDDISLESEEFNRRFELRSADRAFAFALVDARMMQYLLSLERKWTFQVEGNLLLVAITPQLRLDRLDPILPALKGFVDAIPRMLSLPPPVAIPPPPPPPPPAPPPPAVG